MCNHIPYLCKISVMYSLTNTLMTGVHKPGFPKCSRLVGGRNLGMKFHGYIGNVKINFLPQIEYYIPFIPDKKNEKGRWLIFHM